MMLMTCTDAAYLYSYFTLTHRLQSKISTDVVTVKQVESLGSAPLSFITFIVITFIYQNLQNMILLSSIIV